MKENAMPHRMRYPGCCSVKIAISIQKISRAIMPIQNCVIAILDAWKLGCTPRPFGQVNGGRACYNARCGRSHLFQGPMLKPPR